MKVSALIEYLTRYLAENGDVDLDVEIGGNPKTPPPNQPAPQKTPQTALGDQLEELLKKVRSWKEESKKTNPWALPDDWKNPLSPWINDDTIPKKPKWDNDDFYRKFEYYNEPYKYYDKFDLD